MQRRRTRRPAALVGLTAAAGAAMAVGSVLAATSVKPYVEPVGAEYEVRALFSADDKVPLLEGAPGQQYRMVGIPDGLGAHSNEDGTSTLYMNHELGFTVQSEPVVGGPKNRGAIVSKWILDEDGDPIAGRRAYDTIYAENTLLGPAPVVGNEAQMPSQFARFCSAYLAGPSDGFDRYIYLTNEEEGSTSTFDGRGGLSVRDLRQRATHAAQARPLFEGEHRRPARPRHADGHLLARRRPCDPGQPALHVRGQEGPLGGS